MTLLAAMLFLGACKKDKIKPAPDKTGGDTTHTGLPVTLPDEVLFVSAQVLQGDYSIHLLDAATGQLVTTYKYTQNGHSDFCKPMAAKGILYDVERDRINAITMNTGAVLWTDSLGMNTDEASIILHDDTFYGLSLDHNGLSGGDFIYALDAAKKSSAFLWKTPLPYEGSGYNIPVVYFNGLLYLSNDDGFRIDALDAKTGAIKWSVSNKDNAYSLTSLNNGIIIAGHTLIDAASGSVIATVTDPVIPPVAANVTTTTSAIDYVSADRVFIQTRQNLTDGSRTFMSAIDRTTGAEKWRADFGALDIDTTNGGGTATYDTLRFAWQNKLIVESVSEKYTLHAPPYGQPLLTYYAGSWSSLDITTGLPSPISGGESSSETHLGNDDYGNMIVGNMLYGNYVPAGAGITVYAVDLSAGQLKWQCTPLPYTDIYTIFTCLYSRSQDKAYSPYIQAKPFARKGVGVGRKGM